MIRSLFSVAAAALLAAPLLGHFVYVVPQKGNEVIVVFSDSLDPDEAVSIEKIAAIELIARDEAGVDSAVKATVDKASLKAAVPSGTRLVYGSHTYDVLQKGETPPYRLNYHPKAILGDAFAKGTAVGKTVGKLPIEVLVVGKPGAVQFQAIAKGKPLSGIEMSIYPPGAGKKKVTTDAEGLSPAFAETGRFYLWTRAIDPTAGELKGKKYTETKNYATLVVDVSK